MMTLNTISRENPLLGGVVTDHSFLDRHELHWLFELIQHEGLHHLGAEDIEDLAILMPPNGDEFYNLEEWSAHELEDFGDGFGSVIIGSMHCGSTNALSYSDASPIVLIVHKDFFNEFKLQGLVTS